ncbi:MAG: hypothetical protein KJ879_03025, partial [Nanoarchaeota archaeon]|nr:hypothetical protein [Nanoarchaeota archaeon]
ADQIILGNNKSPRSIGIIYYLLAREYVKARGLKVEVPDLEWWTGEIDDGPVKPRRVFKVKGDEEPVEVEEVVA